MSSSTAFAGSWSSLPLPLTDWIYDVIQSLGYQRMTPVQASTIPLFMKNKDVVVEAVTGSGKTLAFVVPIIERLIRRESRHKKNEIGALVISPTRELAAQIHSIFSLFISSQPLSEDSDDEATSKRHPEPLLLVSSDKSSPAHDIERFLSTGADIVIGTPGRVEEFLLGKGRNTVNVKELEVLVLDEADRLLDLGFQATLTKIITHLPKQRRTGLFSATMTDADTVSELVRVGLRNPAKVVVKVQSKKIKGADGQGFIIEERRIPAGLHNYYVPCTAASKLVQLVDIINHEVTQKHSSQLIVYFSTCACVDYFYRILPALLLPSINLYSLHGHLPPNARTRTLECFRTGAFTPLSPAVLLATDVAARGLDIPHVDAVVQFDPPSDPKTFSHRCGRTARAGKSGTAWVLLAGREIEYIDFLAVRKIPVIEHPPFPQSDTPFEGENPKTAVFLDKIRKSVMEDRVLYDLAAKSFVSFVRAYSKHEASYIFRIKDLDLIGVATCFGLLRLPKMPELKNVDRTSWSDADVEWKRYAYLDKAQETKRLAKSEIDEAELAVKHEKQRMKRAEQKKSNAAWSDMSVKKEMREKRKEQKTKKKQWLKSATEKTASSPSNADISRAKRDRESRSEDDNDDDDWNELAKEERLAKKLKKGHITQQEFDQEFADL